MVSPTQVVIAAATAGMPQVDAHRFVQVPKVEFAKVAKFLLP